MGRQGSSGSVGLASLQEVSTLSEGNPQTKEVIQMEWYHYGGILNCLVLGGIFLFIRIERRIRMRRNIVRRINA